MSRALDDALMRLDRAIRTASTLAAPSPASVTTNGQPMPTSDDVAAIRCRPCTVIDACANVIQATPNGQRWGGQVHHPPWLNRDRTSA